MFSIEAFLVVFVLFAVVVCLMASVRILREYERAVVFTLGRFETGQGPRPCSVGALHSGDGAGRLAHSGH